MPKSMKLGGGGRFAALSAKLAKRPGVTDPDALAASIGRKKYGAKRMGKMAAAGRAREAHSGMTHEADNIIRTADVYAAHHNGGIC